MRPVDPNPFGMTMRMRALSVAGVACLGTLTACASRTVDVVPASQPAFAHTGARLYQRIPEQIGAFRLTQRSTVRGLRTDSLFRYSDGSRTLLTVIIYDVPED